MILIARTSQSRPNIRLIFAVFALFATCAQCQTSSTGAITGITLDETGLVLPGISVRLQNSATGESETLTSDQEGRFLFQQRPPGRYEIQAEKSGAVHLLAHANINIRVTEVLQIELHLRPMRVYETVTVSGEPTMVQSGNAALGKVVNDTGVHSLPLVTRNFSQIAGLAPGVTTGVFNAGELGVGGTALSQIAKSNDGIFVHGARSYDNNFLLDGISVSDVQGSASGSGGIPIPNPDSIQEFKVQTGLYDAAYGRYAGANVSVITQTGGRDFHGTLFDFLRNDVF